MPKFVLSRAREFSWPVKVEVPAAGEYTTETFTGRFRTLAADEMASLTQDIMNADKTFLAKVFIGWDDVVDEDGQPVPWSEEMRDRALADPCIAIGVGRAYWDAVLGGGRKRKN